MSPLRLLILGLGTLAVLAPSAKADGGYGPFKGGPKYPTFFQFVHGSHGGHQQPLPVYQAAPWYLYWPYDGHFLTPAPIGGAFYAPPVPGNFPVNPYFPQPSVPYGPIPGGVPPGPR